MHERVIWVTRHDGVTHWATVIGNDFDGYEIRSDCGLMSNACWEQSCHDLTEITCPRCLKISGPNHISPTPAN